MDLVNETVELLQQENGGAHLAEDGYQAKEGEFAIPYVTGEQREHHRCDRSGQQAGSRCTPERTGRYR